MVDLHHHLLPSLDDGPKDLVTSVAMAKRAADDGITHVVCTPHANARYVFDPACVRRKIAELNAALAVESVPLRIGYGCDFHLSDRNFAELLADPPRYTINGGTVLLVELPDVGLSPKVNELLHHLQSTELVPVITHPERNLTLSRDLERIRDFVRDGVLVQITAGSLLGRMGSVAKRIAHLLVSDGLAHFVASDAHNLTSRPPLMSEARDLLTEMYGASCSERLCTSNPLAAFEGKVTSDFYRIPSAVLERRTRWWQTF